MFLSKLLVYYYLMSSAFFVTNASQFQHSPEISVTLPHYVMTGSRYKRSEEKPSSDVRTFFTSNGTLLQKCISAEGFSGKKFSQLDVQEQGQVLGCMNRQFDNVANLLETQLARCDLYQLLLGIRNEFENELMNALYPEGFPATKDQYLKCVFVMVSQTGPMVEEYRRIVKKAGFTFDEFCSLGNKQVYSPKSEIVYKIQIPDHCLTIDHYKSIVRHDKNLQDYINGGHKRDVVINTILELRQARLHPKNRTLGTVKFPETTGKCILISNVPFTDKTTSPSQSTIRNVPQKFQKKNRYMPVEQILAIFRAVEAKKGVQTICETNESNDKRQITGKVLVEFIQPRQAALGMLEHQNTVNQYDITTEFVRCEDFECADEDIMKYQEKY